MASLRARALLMAVVGASAVPIAGCGGDDSKSERDSGVSRPAYIADVDAVCRKTARRSQPTNRKLQALVNASGTYSSRLKKSAPLLRTTYELQKAKLDRIKSMEPPAKDRAQIAAVVKASAQALAEFRGGLPIAARGDLKNFIDILFDANNSRATAERLGTTYGFHEDCFAIPIDLSTL